MPKLLAKLALPRVVVLSTTDLYFSTMSWVWGSYSVQQVKKAEIRDIKGEGLTYCQPSVVKKQINLRLSRIPSFIDKQLELGAPPKLVIWW